jgi:fumarate hydratase class II
MARSTEPTQSSSRRALARAAREATSGKLDEQFPLLVRQADMNLNGMIANRANELPRDELGSKTPDHENDRVDISPSSNDSFQAPHLAAAPHIVHDLVPALSELHHAPRGRAKAAAKIVTTGRTHDRDATPLTLGREFSDRAAQLDRGTKRLELAVTELVLPKDQRRRSIFSMLTYHMMYSIQPLADSVRSFAEHFVNGTLRELMQRSFMMVTTIAPNIGCDNAAKLAKSRYAHAEPC